MTITTWNTDAGDGDSDNVSNWDNGLADSLTDAAIVGSGAAIMAGAASSGHLYAKSLTFADYTGTLTEANPGGFRSFEIYGDFILSSEMTFSPFFNVDFEATGILDTAGQIIAGFAVENFYVTDAVVTLAGDTTCYFAQVGYPGDGGVTPVACVCAIGAHTLTLGGASWGGFLQLASGAKFTWSPGGKIVLLVAPGQPMEMDTAATKQHPLPPLVITGDGEVTQDFPDVPIYATSLIVTGASLTGGTWVVLETATASGGGTITNCDFSGGFGLVCTDCVDGGGNSDNVRFITTAVESDGMTLKTQMAADLTALFLNTDEFADTATYTPKGATSGFTITLAPGDIDESFLPTASGEADRRMAQFVGVLSLLRAGIYGIEGTVRDPRRLDSFVISSGPYMGMWVVERYAADLGGGVSLYARYEQRNQVAANGVLGTSA